ncbi:HRDC domain-containing protein, partial [Candidatus Woesearchaeota archaeon]|nr:HRDC domain-containing protein [Candidatus Woesearchaeota archaeon]
EAEMVFLIGANNANFPCKGSEHPVVEMVKVEEYNKLEEERRLFYVAMSRAKLHLYISYTGKKPTNFMTSDMINMIDGGTENAGFKDQTSNNDIISKIREWRRLKSKEMGVPAFMIINDLTMMDLASKLPLTKLELNNIKGLGPTKIMRWGDEILNVLQS